MSKAVKMDKYILYADDDCEDQELLRDILTEIDAKVQLKSVNNGEEVFIFLQSLQPGMTFPCLILLDLNMPLLNGTETLRKLKEHSIFKKLPVIIFSTYLDEKDEKSVRELGAVDFVRKPVKISEFRSAVINFIHRCEVVSE